MKTRRSKEDMMTAQDDSHLIELHLEPNRRFPYVLLEPIDLSVSMSAPVTNKEGAAEKVKRKYKKGRKSFNRSKIYSKNKPAQSTLTPRRVGCNICGRKFNSQTHLKFHQRIHEGVNPYTCPICAMRHRNFFFLKAHLAKEHPDSPDVQADPELIDADKKPLRKKRCPLKKPIKRIPQEELPCPQPECSYKFTQKHSLEKHVLRTHNNINIPHFSCDGCGSKFLHQYLLNAHSNNKQCQIIIAKNSAQKFKCPIQECRVRFKFERNCRRHLQVSHGIEIQIMPKSRPKKYKKNPNVEVRLLKCPICFKGFQSEKRLDSHTTLFHAEHTCPICGKVFKNRRFFLDHQRRVHSKKPRKEYFNCHLCLKKLSMKIKTRHLKSCVLQHKRLEEIKNNLYNKNSLTKSEPIPNIVFLMPEYKPMEMLKVPRNCRRKQKFNNLRGELDETIKTDLKDTSTFLPFTENPKDQNVSTDDIIVQELFTCTDIFQIKSDPDPVEESEFEILGL